MVLQDARATNFEVPLQVKSILFRHLKIYNCYKERNENSYWMWAPYLQYFINIRLIPTTEALRQINPEGHLKHDQGGFVKEIQRDRIYLFS